MSERPLDFFCWAACSAATRAAAHLRVFNEARDERCVDGMEDVDGVALCGTEQRKAGQKRFKRKRLHDLGERLGKRAVQLLDARRSVTR